MSKIRFKGIRSMIYRSISDGLKTNVGGKLMTLKNAKKMREDIASGRIDRDEAIDMYKIIIGKELKTVEKSLNKMNTKTGRKIINILSQLKEIFVELKTYNEADDKTDNEQRDTTDMPDLESEKSAEQRGQGIKILTPDQILCRLPISLAQ